MIEYKVVGFVPTVKGCGAQDNGWDAQRCADYEVFLNEYSRGGWRLHSTEYRNVRMGGCGGNTGAKLICTFEKNA